MKHNVTLNDISLFITIVEEGSFTKAAAILNCSRSLLSKQLNQLEANLGVSLLSRTTRAQRLTSAGKEFYTQCKGSLQTIDHAILNTINSGNAMQGSININSVGGYIGEEIITTLVNDFLAVYPNISINLDFSSQRVDLIHDDFDLVFRMGKLEDSSLIARKLTNLTIDTLASPQYLKQHGRPSHPKELTLHQCITGSVQHWTFHHQDNNEEVDIPISGTFRCKSGRAMLNSAKQHRGIVRLPTIYCPHELKEQQLISVFEKWQIPATPFYLVYQRDPYQPERLKLFIQFIIDNFARYE
ncbi:LysR family transcriptional regulator [Vibrio sp. SS-MA-C1-2]|uniref:LysR family transcriptional regulator n=1 Tax=Vibrio sp. SS-MA-C1-2 TaxID=2908646 RepID=UPI001F4034B6|nr:LysR family transcriptional regulator [Vibrio sp. SS-MA-C1-2]UJF18604.1 LysR family transcriptional regulator [Vibrio sp. SS-MA-C1-2]